MTEMNGKFESLFRGSTLGHGTYDKVTGNMATLLTPALDIDYERHLNGELGLGIVPVDQNGKCSWGAIDIDIDTIDHKDLYKRIKLRNMPLIVCRSKSGGAHLYVFFKEPQNASLVQGLLRKWAGLLGFPNNTEIFPKQSRSIPDNIGNWLNLPYFSASNTIRYAMGESGSLDITEFLSSIRYYTGNEKIEETITTDLIQIDLMPPCLRTLTQEGLQEGKRNEGLFNFGIFYRKSSPNNWQDKLRNHNKNYVSPPLPSHEVEALIKSLNSRQYQYKCDEEPICSRCDRKTCVTLQYGVTHKPWEDENNYDEASFQNLRKILTDPPTYIMEVNSKDLHFTSDEFRDYGKVKKKVFEVEDLVLRPMKQAQWEQKIRILLNTKLDIMAPDDASSSGAIIGQVDDFLATCGRAQSKEDLIKGIPILDDGKIAFQVEFLQKYLRSQKLNISNQDLFAIIRRRGCGHDLVKIKGKTVRAWSIPIELVNRQTEDFTPARFKKEEPEL